MSAYVVNREHIDALVRVALEGPPDASGTWRLERFRHADLRRLRILGDDDLGEGVTVFDVRRETADDLGRMLWTENVRSVAYRYPNDGPNDRPGPRDFTDAEAEGYTYPRAPFSARHLSIAETFAAIDGLDYQSCETPDWETTPAFAFLAALREALCRVVPGYGTANTWEVTR